MDIEEIGRKVLGAAIKVHTAIGPGLLESAYQACLVYELRKIGLQTESEVLLPVVYGEVKVDAGYRIDILVEGCVIIENKAVEKILPIHEAQLLTYLRMKKCKLGFLLRDCKNITVTKTREEIWSSSIPHENHL
jgi:GxxExxY protein